MNNHSGKHRNVVRRNSRSQPKDSSGRHSIPAKAKSKRLKTVQILYNTVVGCNNNYRRGTALF